MNPKVEVKLWAAQRASAIVLAGCVLVHLVTILWAMHDGLSASEILERTRGSLGWGLFYGLFLVSVSVHASIGLRAVLREWLGWEGRGLNRVTVVFTAALVWLGGRAVWAVI